MAIVSPREPQEAGPGAEGLFQTASQEEVPREECRAAAFDRFISKAKCFALILIPPMKVHAVCSDVGHIWIII